MKLLCVALTLSLTTLGCATKKFVSGEIDAAETRTNRQIEELKVAVEETQTEIRDMAKELNL